MCDQDTANSKFKHEQIVHNIHMVVCKTGVQAAAQPIDSRSPESSDRAPVTPHVALALEDHYLVDNRHQERAATAQIQNGFCSEIIVRRL